MFHSVSNATVETLITYHRQYDTNNIPITSNMTLITILARSDQSGQAGRGGEGEGGGVGEGGRGGVVRQVVKGKPSLF